MEEKRVCQGYTVIDSLRVGEVEIVLAYNPKDVSPYVTWKAYAHSGFQDFNFGNYFSNKQAARADMIARAREAAAIYRPAIEIKKNFPVIGKSPTGNADARKGVFASQNETHFDRRW